ncbi:MAG: type II secretion system protein N [Usitatibacter sp.]
MRPPTIAVLGVAAYAIFLIATVPARYVAAKVQSGSQGRIQLSDATGTVWRGKAKAVVSTPGGMLALDRLDWRFLPARIAAGCIAFDVKAGSPGFETSGELGKSFSAWEVRDFDAHGNVALLATVLPWIAAWRPDGMAQVTSASFSWNGRDARGEMRIEWRGAGLSLAQVRPLGTYRAEVRAEGGPARMKLTTVDGPLRVAGQGTLTLPSRFEFSGEARAEGADAKSLESLLDLMGPRRADGSRALDWRFN